MSYLFWNNKEYEKEYLDETKPQLKDNINNLKKFDTWKTQLRDRTLSIQEGWPEGFCGGHEIF